MTSHSSLFPFFRGGGQSQPAPGDGSGKPSPNSSPPDQSSSPSVTGSSAAVSSVVIPKMTTVVADDAPSPPAPPAAAGELISSPLVSDAASSALVRYAQSSTLLPEHLAQLITAASLAASVSLRASALFVEAILEGAKYSTSTGLGLTRRALVGAVGMARYGHFLTGDRGGNDESYLKVLDKYTNLGIYLIHHTFTLAELFAMSGFYLTSTGIQAGISAADESVRMIDGIFGSNETSRALAAIITLVRREFSDDPRVSGSALSKAGRLASIAALTKALTAFACLQNATRRRTAREMGLQVVYDCTVVKERRGETTGWWWQSGKAAAASEPSRPVDAATPRADDGPSLRASQDPDSTASAASFGAVRTSHVDGRASAASTWTRRHGRDRTLSGDLLMTDVRSVLERDLADEFAHAGDGTSDGRDIASPPPESRSGQIGKGERAQQQQDEEKRGLVEELEYLVGESGDSSEEDERGVETALGESSERVRTRAAAGLPSDVLRLIDSAPESDLERGIVLEGDGAGPSRDRGTTVIRKRKAGNQGAAFHEEVYEITTETTETVTTETRVFQRRVEDDGSTSLQPVSLNDRRGRRDSLIPDDEWVEVAGMLALGGTDPDGVRVHDRRRGGPGSGGDELMANVTDDELERALILNSAEIPEAPNGGVGTAGRGVAALSRMDSLQHPHESAQKFQVVLRTMTKKLVQKRKLVRKVQHIGGGRDADVDGRATPGAPVEEKRSKLLPGIGGRKADRSPFRGSPVASVKELPASATSSSASTPPSGSLAIFSSGQHQHPLRKVSSGGLGGAGVARAFSRARHTLGNAMSGPFSGADKGKAKERARFQGALPADGPTPPQVGPAPEVEMMDATEASNAQAGRPFPMNDGADAHDLSKDLPPIVEGALDTVRSHGGRVRGRRPLSTASMHSVTTTKHVQFSARTRGEDLQPRPDAFPRAHIISNLHRFMRYASAAYGQNFMRILGIGETDWNFPNTRRHHANHHAFAHHTNLSIDAILLSSFTDPPSAFHSSKMNPLVHYVAVDHAAKSIVLTCRGTLGLSDILTDLTCEYEDVHIVGGDPDAKYQAHAGMLASARRLRDERSTVHNTVRAALADYPDFGLVLCGHSLGGGVAAILAILWSMPTDAFLSRVASEQPSRVSFPHPFTPFVTSFGSGLPPGRPIHCYAYGSPAVTSPDLSRYVKGLITTVVHNNDVVPTLSLGILRDLKNIAVSLYEEGSVAEEIVGRVVGIYQRRRNATKPDAATAGGAASAWPSSDGSIPEADLPRPFSPSPEAREQPLDASELAAGRSRNRALDPSYRDPALIQSSAVGGHVIGAEAQDDDLDDWMWSLIKTMRADMDSDKLYPPGDVYIIESFPVFVKSAPGPGGGGRTAYDTRKEAHRVLLRSCDAVEKRFSEPIFARSMFHDHMPTNYELCTQLLYDGILR